MIRLRCLRTWLAFSWLVLSLGAGCQTGATQQPQVLPLTALTSSATLEPAVPGTDPTATPTSILGDQDPPHGLVAQASPTAPSPTPLPDPLRFVFPTPVPEAVSAWRPPLYAVPWAPTLVDHFYFSRPIAADEINWPSQNYRYGGEFFEDVVHTGVDIPAPTGTPVLAAGSGKVIWAGYGVYRGGSDPTDPYGLAVTIRHDYGYQGQTLYTVYGHMQQIDVALGQYVKSGEPLGQVGETGRVTGPHLHFEVRLGKNDFLSTRNPELWIAPPMGWGVLAARIMDSSGKLVQGQQVILTSQATGQNWFARSYGPDSTNPDDYYQENLVVGDLPAGKYDIRLYYAGHNMVGEIEVLPGLVRYFYFYGLAGFEYRMPDLPVELPGTKDGL
ncbi:MAG: peptidoglycan DD-metalloendopeptidase family protein [Anaerolineales bacterium]|jgi:murein DD-endopeptidase MepM/ murein hydrolase activator NlpD|nr:peptidoglycan DD-metalloendopeptidase family protein [Anaerolineales bacterium]